VIALIVVAIAVIGLGVLGVFLVRRRRTGGTL